MKTTTSLLLCLVSFACSELLPAQSPRVLPEGTQPADPRLEPLKDLNGYFPFEVPETLEAWKDRREDLRRRVLVANGLWPMWEKTPLNPVIHGKIERDGFTVEKVYFESLPGFYVTGLLFRPEGEAKEKRPAVLCPHGHGGRLQDHGAEGVLKQIAIGAERFEESGRMPKVARAATLARLGCVTFLYDMIGYADSTQLSRQLAHGFKTQRPEFEGKDSWGLFSTQAELRLQSIFGLQAWNSIRGLDFLQSLPDVDPKRIGVTGGSGGGTQTIILGAIDERPIVAFPNGMVSTSMQGGCTCENTVLLRVGTGNVELAGLFAPKPQGMTAANDWTKEMMTKGFPELQQLYDLYGNKGDVICGDLTHFRHNYNYVSRGIMYKLFNKHLGLGHKEPILEEDFKLLSAEEHAIWNDEHPQPAGGDDFERKLTRYLAEESDKAIGSLEPGSDDYTKIIGDGWKTMIGYGKDEAAIKVPSVAFVTMDATPGGEDTVIWVDGGGRAALYREDGEPGKELGLLLETGTHIVLPDLFMQGDYLADGEPITETRTVKNSREFAGYTHGYNHTLFARRVHDILNLINAEIESAMLVPNRETSKPTRIHLIGTGGAGPLVAAAAAVAEGFNGKVFADTGGFQFADLTSYRDPSFLPGAVKYGDVPGLLALLADRPLWLAGEKKTPGKVAKAFAASKTELKTSVERGLTEEAIGWILETQ